MKKRDVAVLVLFKGNKILLQKRAKDAKRFPGTWGLFGGGVEDGESTESALRREIKEELGLDLETVSLADKCDYVLPEKGESGQIFVFYSKYENQKLCLNEGDRMEWVDLDRSLEYDITPYYRKIIEKIRHNNISVVS